MDCEESEDDMTRKTTPSSEEKESGSGPMVTMEPPHDGDVKTPGEGRVGPPSGEERTMRSPQPELAERGDPEEWDEPKGTEREGK